jgi:hypothetical protein
MAKLMYRIKVFSESDGRTLRLILTIEGLDSGIATQKKISVIILLLLSGFIQAKIS